MGHVTAVRRGLGVVDVQFPYGNEQCFPDDILRVNPKLSEFLPPESVDQTYMTTETEKVRKMWASARTKGLWRCAEVPAGFYRDLAKFWSRGVGEVAAYDQMWRRHAANTPDETLRGEISKYYRLASNLMKLRIQQHAEKSAAYWVAQNRQYRMSQKEVQAGCPSCPKCATPMRKTNYKMREGTKHLLYACPKDLFLIKDTDLIGPQGEALQW